MNVLKGDRVRASWYAARLACLSGQQSKFGASQENLTGVVRHVRGDKPVDPTEVRLYVDPEGEHTFDLVHPHGCTCNTPHVEIRPEWIDAVL